MASITASAAQHPAARPAPARKLPSLKSACIAAAAYLVGVIFLLPYLEMVITALRPQSEINDRDYFPHHVSWASFTNIWSTGLGTNLTISLEVGVGTTVLVLLVAIPAAYYTARRRFRGRAAFLILVLITQMFQPTSLIVGIYQEFTNTVHVPSTVALILVNSGFNLAFAVWILNAYFGAIPKELEEAAMVDGASRTGAMFRIIIPLALPGIVTALIFTFIAAWNELIVALVLTNADSSQPLTAKLDTYLGQYSIDWQHLFAGSVIATIPVIILFALIERKVVSGLTAGSVK
ncbi:carbohydrate ABC transporter permease [Actinospica robiniae]|uniref:carbohydrate ABC transporter permease n=1 Tax=Actinospica robiniae TaxID=304901 RepID=UPI000407380A|nr:carbohydrate ABC transporter permease [Actinospica robiniae]